MWPPMTGRVSRTISTLAGESSRGWARIVSSEVSDVVMGTLLRIHSPTAVEGVDSERRSEEHTSELQSRFDLVCRLLLEKKKSIINYYYNGISFKIRSTFKP